MAWTCRDVTLRLRRELGDDSLHVQFDVVRRRYVVSQRVRRVAGARRHRFSVADDGTIVPSSEGTLVREVVTDYEPIYFHEGPDGEYLPLEPNTMRLEVLARDSHRHDVAGGIIAVIRARRAARQKEFDDTSGEIAKDTRRVIARYADEIGA